MRNMMTGDTTILAGIVAFATAIFSWLFKTTAIKASDAMASSIDLKRRMVVLEEKCEEFSDIKVGLAEVKIETKNINSSLARIEKHIFRDK